MAVKDAVLIIEFAYLLLRLHFVEINKTNQIGFGMAEIKVKKSLAK